MTPPPGFERCPPYRPTHLLALETSCDETSVAILKDGREILVNLIASQVDLHSRYGGVVPEIACRRHLEVVHPLLEQALEQASLNWSDLDAIAVTHGPGLIGAVLVGVAVAKGLSVILNRPLIGVNHLAGHIYSPFLDHPDLEPPLLSLLVSGGHTMLVHLKAPGHFETLGQTRDDAAGEAFDKVAKLLGLGYPGGPLIQALAGQGDPQAVALPRPMKGKGFGFSFSGLKTAVWHALEAPNPPGPADLCASFQEAVTDVLVSKTVAAAQELGVTRLSLVGGVACNQRLRAGLSEACRRRGWQLYLPSPTLCTDNAAMIARAGYQLASLGWRSHDGLDATPSLALGDWTVREGA